MLDPTDVIELTDGGTAELTDRGNHHDADLIVGRDAVVLTGDSIPPRFDTDRLYKLTLADCEALIPDSDVQAVRSVESALTRA